MPIELLNFDTDDANDTIKEVVVQQEDVQDKESDFEAELTSIYNSSDILKRHFKLDEFIKPIKLLIKDPQRESFDLVVENQRGFYLLGLPFFSGKSLIEPLDPPQFTTINSTRVLNLKNYPIDNINYKWSWPKWYILMSINDIDDQGFSYSWRFNSKKWCGVFKFGYFVRVRFWIRVKERCCEAR